MYRCAPAAALVSARYDPLNSVQMPDDTSKTRPQDASKVNIHEDYEVQYWTKKFGVTAEQLRGRRRSRHVRSRGRAATQAAVACRSTSAIWYCSPGSGQEPVRTCRCRDRADLLQQPQLVPAVPALNDLAAGCPDYDDAQDADPPSGSRSARRVRCVRWDWPGSVADPIATARHRLKGGYNTEATS
jgi:hypothetical protein